ncbi:tenascin-R-like [Branchiostoma floridae x Branchiostoma japonicum]
MQNSDTFVTWSTVLRPRLESEATHPPIPRKIFCFARNQTPALTPPPEDFQVVSITETSVRVSWRKQRTDSFAIGHRIWIARMDTGEIVVTRYVPTSSSDVTFNDLRPAVEYVISATSINRYNEGPEVTITAATRTDPPIGLGVDDWTTDTISISWLTPKAVLTAYNITYTGDGRRTSIQKSGDVDRCELTGLVPGTRYDIGVVAVSRLGRSIAVSTAAVTDTDAPSSLRVSVAEATWMLLEWMPPVANVLSYQLDISDEYDSAIIVLRFQGNKTSYNVTNLIPETAYVIKMAAFGEHGRSVDVTYSHRTGSMSPIEATADGSSYTTTSTTDVVRPDAETSTPTWSTSPAEQNIKGTTGPVKTTIAPSEVGFDDDTATDARTTTSSGKTVQKVIKLVMLYLQEIVEEIDISDLVRPENILTVMSNIYDIISAGGDVNSPLPPPVLVC